MLDDYPHITIRVRRGLFPLRLALLSLQDDAGGPKAAGPQQHTSLSELQPASCYRRHDKPAGAEDAVVLGMPYEDKGWYGSAHNELNSAIKTTARSCMAALVLSRNSGQKVQF